MMKEGLPESYLKSEKLKLCRQIILDCSGIYIEVTAEDYAFLNDKELELTLSILNRSKLNIAISDLKINGNNATEINKIIKAGDEIEEKFIIKPSTILSGPYWLRNEFSDVFDIDEIPEKGQAEAPATLIASLSFASDQHSFTIDLPVEYVWRVPSYGEKRRDLIRTPEFTGTFDEKIVIVNGSQSKTVRMKVHAFKDSLLDKVNIQTPKGWTVSPSEIAIDIKEKQQEQWVESELQSHNEPATPD